MLKNVYSKKRKTQMRMLLCKIFTTLALITLLPPVMLVVIVSKIAEVIFQFAYTVRDLWAMKEEEETI